MGGRRAWALMAAAVLVPGGILVAVLLAPMSDAGQVRAAVRAPAVNPTDPVAQADAGDLAPPADPGDPGDPATPGARVSTRDGRLSFVAPQGWLYGPCPQPSDTCVEISPTMLSGGDGIDVLVSAPAPGDSSDGESTLAEMRVAESGPGTTSLTVDRRPAVRIDLASNSSVLVFGPMPVRGERFLVSCRYDRRQQQIRQGCDQVTDTLTIAVS